MKKSLLHYFPVYRHFLCQHWYISLKTNLLKTSVLLSNLGAGIQAGSEMDAGCFPPNYNPLHFSDSDETLDGNSPKHVYWLCGGV